MNLLAIRYATGALFRSARVDDLLTGHGGEYLKGRPDLQHAFCMLFESIPCIVTSAHVIGELQGLSGKLRLTANERRDFWNAAMHYLQQTGVSEECVQLDALNRDAVYQRWVGIVGPTDTGIIRIARINGCPILTDDERTLLHTSYLLGAECHLIRNLILTA